MPSWENSHGFYVENLENSVFMWDAGEREGCLVYGEAMPP